jgi:hypothetical protein
VPGWVPAVVAVLVTALLLVVTAVSPWSSAVGVVLGAIIPVVVAIPHGPRVSGVAALLNPVAAGVGVLVNSRPVAVAALMAVATVGVAFAVSRGLRAPAVYLAIEAGLAAVGRVPPLPNDAASVPLRALVCAGLALAAGLVVAALHRLLLRGRPPVSQVRLDRRPTVEYGLLLGVALVPTSWLVATYWPGSRAGWLLLTILIAVRPAVADTRRVVAYRVLGTVAGAAVAAVLAFTLPSGAPTIAAGVICAVVAVATRLQRVHYAVFVTALTPAVVLLGAHSGEVWTRDVARVGYTLVATLAVIVVSAAGQALLQRIAPRAPEQPVQST